MQTNTDKNNYNPDLHHDTDDQLEDNVNFDDENLSEEEFNDQKKKIQWARWIKLSKQKIINNKSHDLTETKLSLLKNWSACFLVTSLILFCLIVILYFATYPSLNGIKIILNVLVAFSLASNFIALGCYLALRWWSYHHAKSVVSSQFYSLALWRWGLIALFIICFVLLEIWWIFFSVSTIANLAISLAKLYDSWCILLGCIWLLFSIVLFSYFVTKSMLNKAIELKCLWFWLILICFFIFLVIAYFVFGVLGINHQSLIPGKALFMTACVIGIFAIYPTIINYRLYLNELFY